MLLIQLSKDEASSRTVLDPKEIDTSYWRYLQGISYHHFKGYLKSLKAEEHFDQVIVNKNIPNDLPEYHIEDEMLIVDVIFDSKMSSSKSEARRLIKQGAVSIDGEKINDTSATLNPGSVCVIKVGKRRFLQLV